MICVAVMPPSSTRATVTDHDTRMVQFVPHILLGCAMLVALLISYIHYHYKQRTRRLEHQQYEHTLQQLRLTAAQKLRHGQQHEEQQLHNSQQYEQLLQASMQQSIVSVSSDDDSSRPLTRTTNTKRPYFLALSTEQEPGSGGNRNPTMLPGCCFLGTEAEMNDASTQTHGSALVVCLDQHRNQKLL